MMPRKGDPKWETENSKRAAPHGEGRKRWWWQACSQLNGWGDWSLSPPSAQSKNCGDTTLLQLPLWGPGRRGQGSRRPGFWAVQLPRGLPESEHASGLQVTNLRIKKLDRILPFQVPTLTPTMGPSQMKGTSDQASPGHPASVAAVGRKWNKEDSQAAYAVKSTGCLLVSFGLRDGMAGGNNPREREQGRRHRFGMESGISLWVGGFQSLLDIQGELPAACSCCFSLKLGDQDLGVSSTQPRCWLGHLGSAWSSRCGSGTAAQRPQELRRGGQEAPWEAEGIWASTVLQHARGPRTVGGLVGKRDKPGVEEAVVTQRGSAADSSRKRLGRKVAGAASCPPLTSSEAFSRV